MATPLLWTRQADTIGVLGLALNACYERNGYPDELEQIKELLSTAQGLWRSLPEIEDEGERMASSRATFALVHLADIISVTPRVLGTGQRGEARRGRAARDGACR